MNPQKSLGAWTLEQLKAECSALYGKYCRELETHYTEYFGSHPEIKAPNYRYCASTIARNLPPDLGELSQRIAPKNWHRWARSAKSSQALAVALLGSAEKNRTFFPIFGQALELQLPATGVEAVFEKTLNKDDLNEIPRQTSIDYFVHTKEITLCIECKWSEEGMGGCSCARSAEGDPRTGKCSARVLERPKYWAAARETLSLPERSIGQLCPLSFSYQAVRNIAVAKVLAGDHPAVFVLIYDANNPYFRQTGQWPGWPAILEATVQPETMFRSISWQSLVPQLPLPPAVRQWAKEKHRLG